MDKTNTNKENTKQEKKETEIGGPSGPEPTRYGNHSPEWEIKGRVSDF